MSYRPRRPLRGLGFSYYDLLDQTDRENCDPRDAACVMRNGAKVTAVQELWNAQYLGKSDAQMGPLPTLDFHVDNSDAALNQFLNNIQPVAGLTVSGPQGGTISGAQLSAIGQAAVAAQLPAAAQAKGGQLSFSTSRGGTTLFAGDTWVIKIAGASPNSPVTVSGSMPSGSFSNSAMGSTDGSGNFSKSGTFSAADIGSWSESWAVGGSPAGSFAFTVAAAQTTPAGQVIINSAGAQNAPGSTTGWDDLKIGGFSISSIPWWGWAAGAAGAFFMFGGKR